MKTNMTPKEQEFANKVYHQCLHTTHWESGHWLNKGLLVILIFGNAAWLLKAFKII